MADASTSPAGDPAQDGTKRFKVDARTILALGRESIKQHTTALVELVKNSYDAGSDVVEVNVHTGGPDTDTTFLQVTDAGCGMTEEDLDKRWLRIGYSEKRDNPYAGKRRKTGEKGIGRISADRLGGILELRTKASRQPPTGLLVEWDRFDRSGRDLASIPIDAIEDANFSVPTRSDSDGKYGRVNTKTGPTTLSGTDLIIRNLRDIWTKEDVVALREELSVFSSPFHRAQDFEIRLLTDVDPSLVGAVASSFVDLAEVEVRVVYGGDKTLTYEIWERDDAGKRLFVRKDSPKIAQLIAPRRLTAVSETSDGKELSTKGKKPNDEDQERLTCGPAEVRLIFLPRKTTTVRATKLSLGDLKSFLDKNAGIRIYRDRIRVKPYGDPAAPEGDWLRLGARKAQDPAGAGRKTFRAAPNQLVGAVFLTRDDNAAIADSSSREGLIQGTPFEDLKRLVLAAIRLLETHYHEGHQARTKPRTPIEEQVTGLRNELETLTEILRSARHASAGAARRDVERSIDHVSLALKRVESVEASIEETASQAIIFRGLATLGIAAAVFAHETETSINLVVAASEAAAALLRAKPPGIKDAITEIEKAIAASSRVAAWGHFALTRVRRDKRRRKHTDIEKIVQGLGASLLPTFTANQIDLELKTKPTAGKTFAMDVESVLLNFLTNAYEFCKAVKRKRQVNVYLRPERRNGIAGFELAVGDSGPGVNKDFEQRIWEPLFTTRHGGDGGAAGTGLGLSIVQSVVDEHKGVRSIGRDPELKGALFSVWLPTGENRARPRVD